ncbi:MAG: ABC transporter ATP-binding protein [Planctomycetota bacterium]
MTLACEGLSAGYDGDVLRGVSLAFARGERTAIIGANGCGKSTLLRTLSGQLRARAGRVTLESRDVRAMAPRWVAQRLAFLPQSPEAPWGLSVRELVWFGRTPHTRAFVRAGGEDEAAVEGALRASGAAHLADKRVHELSGGERQRAWVASCLAQQTGVLLLDEPTSALDPRHQLEVLQVVCAQAGAGAERAPAVVVVLHDLNHAGRFFDRVVLLGGGGVLADGPPGDVLTREHLLRGYGVDAAITEDPDTGRPWVRVRTPSGRDPSVM